MATENIEEYFPLPNHYVGDYNVFMLTIVGESMIEAGILDGDYAVIRKQDHAENGTVVVASMDGQATLKKLFRKRGQVELHAANPKYAPIVVMPPTQIRIEGVLTGVLRNLNNK